MAARKLQAIKFDGVLWVKATPAGDDFDHTASLLAVELSRHLQQGRLLPMLGAATISTIPPGPPIICSPVETSGECAVET